MKLKYLKLFLYAGLSISGLFIIIVTYFSLNLPDYNQLRDYKPSIMTRVHNSSGELIKEYSNEYRVFIPIEAVPDIVKSAFISAEDKNFYRHIAVSYTHLTLPTKRIV